MELRDVAINIEEYLRERFGPSAKLTGMRELGGSPAPGERELKGFGYGKPYLIEFTVGGEKKSAVLSSMKPDRFGHDHLSDRAQVLLWQYCACNRLPRHAKALDVGYFTKEGKLISAAEAEEYFILREKVEGVEYSYDLERIMAQGMSELDEKRARALSQYLVEIHSIKREEPTLYIRRVRDLVGHGECIMGMIDAYRKDYGFVTWDDLKEIEKKCVDWRWRLKEKTYRLSQVHGDFHPFNVLFSEETEFALLDRSRGEWGEPADDVSSMSINYIFFSLQRYGKLAKDFEVLFHLFMEHYLHETGDEEILEVIAPFYAFRGLVVASPVWYPSIDREVREKLFNFIKNVLEEERFIPREVNRYLEV